MKTAAILRQMPVAPSSRLLGQRPALAPRPPVAAHPPATRPAPEAVVSPAPAAAPPAVVSVDPALTEAEIEQRSLALAQRMMQAESDQLRKAAREEGLRAGREEGLRQAQTQVVEQLAAQQARFQEVADALVQALARDRQATEDAALELALAALARMLGEAPDAARVAAVVRQAGAQLRDPGQWRVRMAPADIELLKEAGIDPAALAPQAADVQWVADPAVQGGCVLQTATGNLDARLHKQVAALADALSQAYRTRGEQA
jgi:flagellar biosynthesis/type III secretory pathway protein FliH